MIGKHASKVVVTAALCGLTVPAVAETADANLQAEIAALRAEVAQLRQSQNDSWLNERRAEEVKGLIREVLADADTRASLLQDGVLAGHDGRRFYLRSADGGFALNIGGQIQLRYIANFRDDAEGVDGGYDSTTGFQHRRTRLVFSGHIADPRITFRIQPEVRRQDGRMAIADSFLGYKLTDDIELQGGRFKLPFWKEDLHSSGRQLAVERSLINNLFSGDRSTGLMATYSQDMFRVYGMVSNGFGTNLHDFNTGVDSNAARVAFTGRAEVKVAGEWSQYNDFAGWENSDFGLIIGGAAHWEQNRATTPGGTSTRLGNTRDFFTWTADASVYMQNINVFGAVVGYHDTAVYAGDKFDDYAFLIQGGYTIADKFQPFGRYEFITFDDDRNVSDISVITVGANYFLRGHNAKLTGDVVWVLDPLPSGSGGLGLLPSSEDDQVVVRMQFQLLF
jgi:phosphate-selective porin OprO/OprP